VVALFILLRRYGPRPTAVLRYRLTDGPRSSLCFPQPSTSACLCVLGLRPGLLCRRARASWMGVGATSTLQGPAGMSASTARCDVWTSAPDTRVANLQRLRDPLRPGLIHWTRGDVGPKQPGRRPGARCEYAAKFPVGFSPDRLEALLVEPSCSFCLCITCVRC
jgi:hypothetical protein